MDPVNIHSSKRRSKKSGLTLLLLLLTIAAIAASVFFYQKYQDSQDKLKNPQVVARAETDQLISKLKTHIVLPADEYPTVATVTDITKLKNQPFFDKAQNGDKLFIYTKAKKAVLYRPSTDKVIEVAPLNITSTKDKKTTTDSTPQTNTNGTNQQP